MRHSGWPRESRVGDFSEKTSTLFWLLEGACSQLPSNSPASSPVLPLGSLEATRKVTSHIPFTWRGTASCWRLYKQRSHFGESGESWETFIPNEFWTSDICSSRINIHLHSTQMYEKQIGFLFLCNWSGFSHRPSPSWQQEKKKMKCLSSLVI